MTYLVSESKVTWSKKTKRHFIHHVCFFGEHLAQAAVFATSYFLSFTDRYAFTVLSLAMLTCFRGLRATGSVIQLHRKCRVVECKIIQEPCIVVCAALVG